VQKIAYCPATPALTRLRGTASLELQPDCFSVVWGHPSLLIFGAATWAMAGE
jgi:hypothetical protein